MVKVVDYHKFQDTNEKLKFMKKYELVSPKTSDIPRLFYRPSMRSPLYQECQLLGYTKEYDTWCSMVIDCGEGPFEIHNDYLKEMQQPDRQKGKSLNKYSDTFVVFDFETTGINLRSCEIIQIGAIKYENGKEIATFNEYVKPEHSIPPGITKLTGITDLHVCNAPDIRVVLKRFIDFIGDNVLVGYNIASFDTTLLYDFAMILYGIQVSNSYIDLRSITSNYLRKHDIKLKDVKQTTIAEYFGIDTTRAHQALNDCYITLECYNIVFGVSTPDLQFSSSSVLPTSLPTNPQRFNPKVVEEFEQRVKEILQEIIVSEELPENSLYLSANVSHKGEKKGQEVNRSICVHEPDYPANSHNVDRVGKNDTFLLIKYKTYAAKTKLDDKYILMVKDRYLLDIALPEDTTTNKQLSFGDFTEVSFSLGSVSIYSFIRDVVMQGLAIYESTSSFACCSQFIRCSDEKKCVHVNKLYSKGCMYRTNLEAGRIFYGKNRNIDP